MPHVGYEWDIQKAPPPIEDHSIAKHQILESYLIKYAEVLSADPRMERLRLTLIDGFAGGGLYTSMATGGLHEGSPLIFLRAMKTAQASLNTTRTRPFNLDAEFFFVEERALTLKYLRELVERQEDLPRWKIHYREGTFANNVDSIIAAVRERGRAHRAIFLLDQYGYSDVPLQLLHKILTSLPKAEVILTFAVDSLLDYLSDTNAFRKIIHNLGVNHFNLRHIETLKKSSSDWRFLIQSQLYKAIVHGSSANFFTPFFIRSRQSNRSYWLLHLSNHVRARDEMAKLHWQKHTYFTHHGSAGLDMLGYDPRRDSNVTGQEKLEFFFDEEAHRLTSQALMLDIPKVLAQKPDGISFSDLLCTTCNNTPATSEIYKEVIGNLLDFKEIEVISTVGGIRKKGCRVTPTDLIKLPSQTKLIFERPIPLKLPR
jgi:three-Cys-motif partner protein